MNATILIVILGQAIDWFSLLVIIYILLSWIPSVLRSPIGVLLTQIVEPALYPFRKIIPTIYGLDLAPLSLIITLEICRGLLVSLLAV